MQLHMLNVIRLHKLLMMHLSYMFFFMNHSMRLAMFNEICPLKLLVVADTSFASILVKNDEANKKKSAIPGY